jgi:hypothetical protein
VRDADDIVLWCDSEHTDGHPAMPSAVAVELHDVVVFARRLADAYDGCAGPLQPHDENGWDRIDLNLLACDVSEALDAQDCAALPALALRRLPARGRLNSARLRPGSRPPSCPRGPRSVLPRSRAVPAPQTTR